MPEVQPSTESSFIPFAAETMRFDCVLSHRDHETAWIRADGELDIASAPRLKRTLRDAIESARSVVLDLRGLTFIDSTGIHVLIETDAQARRAGRRLTLVRGAAHIERVFELVGLSDRLEIVDPEELDSA